MVMLYFMAAPFVTAVHAVDGSFMSYCRHRVCADIAIIPQTAPQINGGFGAVALRLPMRVTLLALRGKLFISTTSGLW